MIQENTEYIMACDFELLKAEDVLAETDLAADSSLREKYIVMDKLYERFYLINASIYNFLLLFAKPMLIQDVFAELNIKEGDVDARQRICEFFAGLQDKGILATIEENLKIQLEVNELNNLPEIQIEDCSIIRVFKQTQDIWVGLVKPDGEQTPIVVKRLLFNSTYSEREKRRYEKEFSQEFRIMKELSEHTAICNFISYDKEVYEGRMEYVEGETLRSYMKKNKISLQKQLELVTTLLSAFAFIQNKDIVHGDIHASNFMIDKNENLKLIDFGMSSHTHLQKNEIMKKGGAYYYIPPERVSKEPFKILNKNRTDFLAETYQLGLIMYYILYAKTPYTGITWKELSSNISEKSITFGELSFWGEKIPEEVINILAKALQKKPSQRYSNATELYNTWVRMLQSIEE